LQHQFLFAARERFKTIPALHKQVICIVFVDFLVQITERGRESKCRYGVPLADTTCGLVQLTSDSGFRVWPGDVTFDPTSWPAQSGIAMQSSSTHCQQV